MRYLRRSIIPLIIAAFTVLLAACNNDVPKAGAIIEGKVTGFPAEDTIVASLFHLEGNRGPEIMKDTLVNGCICFRLDSLAGSNKYSIMLTKRRSIGHFPSILCLAPTIYLEPGARVRISGDGNYLYSAKIDSPVKEQKLRQRFIKKLSADDLRRIEELFVANYAVTNEIYYGGISSEAVLDSLRAEQRKIKELHDSVSHRLNEQELRVMEKEELGQFALEELSDLAYSVTHGREDLTDQFYRVYDRLTEEQKQSQVGQDIANKLGVVKPVHEGEQFPDYVFKDGAGADRMMSELKGKWVLVDYWNRGCGPCIAAMPELKGISEGYKDVVVVSISTDSEVAWKDAESKHGITWTSWRDPKGINGTVRAYREPCGVPTFVVVNPEGTIVKIQVGYSEGLLHQLLDEAVK